MVDLDGRKGEPAVEEEPTETGVTPRRDGGTEESLPRESREATPEDESDGGASGPSHESERRPTGEDVDSGRE